MTIHLNRRTILVGLAASLATPALGTVALAEDAGAAIIYTSNSAQSVDAVLEVARKTKPNLKISTVTGGSGQLLRRIEAEVAKPQGDVFWSSSANTLGAFKPLFEPYKVVDHGSIVPALRQPQDLWTAANIHVAVVMLNKGQLGGLPEPKTWADLLNPAFKGKMTIADPANSSTAYTILWGIDKLLGGDALKKLADNIKVTASAPTVLRSVGQGEFAIGLTFESNAYAYVAGGQKEIALVYPADGTYTTPEFYTLIKGAPGGALAQQACDLLASKEVQIALLESAFRRPTRSDIEVAKHAELPELSKIKVFEINEEEAAAQRKDFLARFAALVAAAGN